jgi:DNA replication ATP-dependent helicase Dna2
MGTQITAAPTQRGAMKKTTPRKSNSGDGKENRRPTPKKAKIGERVLLKGKLITRDILNEMTNGAF